MKVKRVTEKLFPLVKDIKRIIFANKKVKIFVIFLRRNTGLVTCSKCLKKQSKTILNPYLNIKKLTFYMIFSLLTAKHHGFKKRLGEKRFEFLFKIKITPNKLHLTLQQTIKICSRFLAPFDVHLNALIITYFGISAGRSFAQHIIPCFNLLIKKWIQRHFAD